MATTMYEEIAIPATHPHLETQMNAGQKAVNFWAVSSLADRLRVLKRARHTLAESADELVLSLAHLPGRNPADSLAAEVLPLLEACRFLERNARHVLRTRALGRHGLPFWLAGLRSRVERVALGSVLVIGPSNYPLFLPGVQTLQALAAGNQVVWKPGRGGEKIARLFAAALERAGLPGGVLRVTDESVESVATEIDLLPDKIVFTGSAQAGRAVASLAAQHAIPVIAELSGCDAVVVLPSADPARVVAALTLGMRLNGSATCMAPRRLFLVGAGFDLLLDELQKSFAQVSPIELNDATHRQLNLDLEQARSLGATVTGQVGEAMLVLNGRPDMRIARADIFAPVLTVLRVPDEQALENACAACPYALTVAVFGDQANAERIAKTLCAGTVVLNDLIVPTADPRVPFGGRKASGYGVTRGAEGLLEMTAVRTVLVRRGKSQKHYEPTGDAHARMFRGVVGWQHAAGWRARLAGFKAMVKAAREIR